MLVEYATEGMKQSIEVGTVEGGIEGKENADEPLARQPLGDCTNIMISISSGMGGLW